MGVKRFILTLSFAFLFLLAGLTISSVLNPTGITGFISQISSGTETLSLSTKGQPTGSTWKKYVDENHGFSFEYPNYWAQLEDTEAWFRDSEPPGISVLPLEVKTCTTADNYFQEEVLPYYANIRRVVISNPNLDGFIVVDQHLENVTPDSEAYILNCPYVIRLGLNPTGIEGAEKIFYQIIASFKTWRPPN